MSGEKYHNNKNNSYDFKVKSFCDYRETKRIIPD